MSPYERITVPAHILKEQQAVQERYQSAHSLCCRFRFIKSCSWDWFGFSPLFFLTYSHFRWSAAAEQVAHTDVVLQHLSSAQPGGFCYTTVSLMAHFILFKSLIRDLSCCVSIWLCPWSMLNVSVPGFPGFRKPTYANIIMQHRDSKSERCLKRQMYLPTLFGTGSLVRSLKITV